MIHFNIVLQRRTSSSKCSVRPSGFSVKVLQAFAISFTQVIIHQLQYTVDSNTKHIKSCRICTGGDVYTCMHAYVCTSEQTASCPCYCSYIMNLYLYLYLICINYVTIWHTK